jgi:hypothetical protein
LRALVILGPATDIEDGLLTSALKVEITRNRYPKEEGVAIFNCGKEPNYEWPDYIIVVGQCEMGRHHFDLQIGKTEDATSKIIETLDILSDSDVMEEGPSEQSN